MATSQVTRYNNHIGGKWVESSTGRTYTITNPASNESVLAEFQTSGVDDALKAVDAAHEALAGWANTPLRSGRESCFALSRYCVNEATTSLGR